MFLRRASLLAALVAQAHAQVGPGGGSDCSPIDPSQPCLRTCTNGKFDLSGFKTNTPATGYYHASDDSQHDYYFDACSTIAAVTCTGSSIGQPAALQSWGAPQPPTFPANSCAALGSEPTISCKATDGKGVTCDYTGGDDSRTVSLSYSCADTYGAPVATAPGQLAYSITLSGPAGCAGAGPGGGGGGGWGTMFLTLLPVTVALYLAAGYGYNYKYGDMRGIEAVPQLEYWKQVPGLVSDGCAFSWKQTLAFVAYVKAKQGGHSDELHQGLATSEDGGPTSDYNAS